MADRCLAPAGPRRTRAAQAPPSRPPSARGPAPLSQPGGPSPSPPHSVCAQPAPICKGARSSVPIGPSRPLHVPTPLPIKWEGRRRQSSPPPLGRGGPAFPQARVAQAQSGRTGCAQLAPVCKGAHSAANDRGRRPRPLCIRSKWRGRRPRPLCVPTPLLIQREGRRRPRRGGGSVFPQARVVPEHTVWGSLVRSAHKAHGGRASGWQLVVGHLYPGASALLL